MANGKNFLYEKITPPPTTNLSNHRDADIMSQRTDEEIFKVISEGGPAMGFTESMPPHKTVMPREDMEGLVKYIRKLCACEYKK